MSDCNWSELSKFAEWYGLKEDLTFDEVEKYYIKWKNAKDVNSGIVSDRLTKESRNRLMCMSDSFPHDTFVNLNNYKLFIGDGARLQIDCFSETLGYFQALVDNGIVSFDWANMQLESLFNRYVKYRGCKITEGDITAFDLKTLLKNPFSRDFNNNKSED